MNRRKTDRIMMEAPIRVGANLGTIRDISDDGIYFVIDEEVKLDGDIRFSIDLEHVIPEKPLQLKCQAVILRTEDFDGQTGVAAKINKYCYVH